MVSVGLACITLEYAPSEGLGIGFYAAVLAGNDPHFLDTGASVEGEFGVTVVVNGGVGDLY